MRQRVQKLVDTGVMQIVAVTDPTADRLRPAGHDRDLGRRATSRRSPTSSPRSTRSTTSSSPPARSTSSPRSWSRTTTTCSASSTAGSARSPASPAPRRSSTSSSSSRPTTGARDDARTRRRNHMTTTPIETSPKTYDGDAAVGRRPRAPVDALHPHVVLRERAGADDRARRGRAHLRRHRAAATSTGCPGCSSCRPATAARNWPRPRTSRPRSSPSSRSGPTPTRRRSSWPTGWPRSRPATSTRSSSPPAAARRSRRRGSWPSSTSSSSASR